MASVSEHHGWSVGTWRLRLRAAARWLQQRGVKPVVLEARDRVGGRIHTVEMGNGSPVDLGAAYIHGCDASYNPARPPPLELLAVA